MDRLSGESEIDLEAAPPAGWGARAKGWLSALGQILYGMSVYEMVRDVRKERGQLQRVFVLLTFGDLLGVPVLPPYYALRLLPFVAPEVETWRRSMCRERDLTDLCDQELG